MVKYLTPQQFNKIFFIDGSLRDIYVFNVSLNDWQSFLESSHWNITLYKDGDKAELRQLGIVELFKVKKYHQILLQIEFKGVQINCFLPSEDEMEFDIKPGEIKTPLKANLVIEFMMLLSKTIGKEIILTEENTPESALIIVNNDKTLIA